MQSHRPVAWSCRIVLIDKSTDTVNTIQEWLFGGQAACICQTLHFFQKEDVPKTEAVKMVADEYEK